MERQQAPAQPVTGNSQPRASAHDHRIHEGVRVSLDRGRLMKATTLHRRRRGRHPVTTKLDPGDPFRGLWRRCTRRARAVRPGVPLKGARSRSARNVAWRSKKAGAAAGDDRLSQRPFLDTSAPARETFRLTAPGGRSTTSTVADQVRRSAIRVDADELTYRCMWSCAMASKGIFWTAASRRDLPSMERGMQDRLEVTPAHAAEGCLQDVHWPMAPLDTFRPMPSAQ